MMTTISPGHGYTVTLPAGQVLTVAADTYGSGSVSRLSDDPGGEPQGYAQLVPTETRTYGPFLVSARFLLEAVTGAFGFTILPSQPIPFVGQPDDLREYSGAGVPDATAQATLAFNPDGDDNGLTITAVAFGAAGNGISISYVDPGAHNASLAVSVVGRDITVSLATGSDGSITSTAAQIHTALATSRDASALVSSDIDVSDSGSGDDGSGIVTAMARDYLAGGAGIGIGEAGKGSTYTDTTNGKLYINSGTKDVPVWDLVTSGS